MNRRAVTVGLVATLLSSSAFAQSSSPNNTYCPLFGCTFWGPVTFTGGVAYDGPPSFDSIATFNAGFATTTGTFSGVLTGTIAAFSGGLSATTGSFTGALGTTSTMSSRARLTINLNTATLPAPPAALTTTFHTGQLDSTNNRHVADSFDAINIWLGRRAQGTASSPSALGAGNRIVEVSALGYGSTGYSSAPRGTIYIGADQAWTDTSQSTSIGFFTTSIGSTTAVERMRFDSRGHMTFKGTAPAVTAGAMDCGTSPAIVGNDNAFRLTVGSGTNGGKCTVTFNVGWGSAPMCSPNNETSALRGVSASSTATATVINAATTLIAGDLITVSCRGIF